MKRWKYWLLQFAQWQCILWGYTTIVIDFKNGRLKTYKLVKIYVIIINVVNVMFNLNSIYLNFSLRKVAGGDLITFFSYTFTALLRVIMSMVVIIMQPRRDKSLEKWLKEMFLLYFKHLIKYKSNTPQDTSLRKLWIFNTLLFILHSINLMVYMGAVINIRPFYLVIELYFICSITGMQHLIMLHHAAILCYITEGFSMINYHLQHVGDRSFGNLNMCYFRLCQLLKQINVIYRPITFGLHLNFLMTVSLMFFSLIVITTNGFFRNTLMFTVTFNLYFLFIIHMCVYYILCDHVWHLHWKTLMILHQLEAGENDKEIENFCLNRALIPNIVSVRGMFNFNLSLLFEILALILKYIIILLQIEIQMGRRRVRA